MAIGDVHSNEVGSGARFNDGKVPYELIPTHLLESTARVLGFGASKYAPWNWAKGMPFSVVIGCLKRHLAAIERGEDLDPETGFRHTGHLMCNLLFLEHYMNQYPELDDRPKTWFSKPAETKLAKAAPLHHIALEMKENNDNEQGTSGRTIEQYYDSLEQRRVSDVRPNVQSYTS